MSFTNASDGPATNFIAKTTVSIKDSDKLVVYSDALRLIAITAVVASHFTSLTDMGHGHNFGWLGYWGVDCFFVLTGLLLSRRFLEAFLGRKPFPSLKEYFLRRFFRIYPLYFFALVFSICVAIASGHTPNAGNILTHLTLTHGFFPQYVMAIDSPLWTMSVDAQFYCILPMVALAASRLVKGISEPQRVRLAWQGLGLIIIASVLERAIVLLLHHRHHLDPLHYTVDIHNIIGMGADFGIGASLALANLTMSKSTFSIKYKNVGYALGLVLFFVVARAPRGASDNPLYICTQSLEDLVGGLSAGALLYGAIYGNLPWLTNVLNSRFVVQGAALAYGIYLFHLVIIDHAHQLYHGSLSSPIAAFTFCLLVLVTVTAIAAVAHRLIETPGLRLRDGLREPSPAPP